MDVPFSDLNSKQVGSGRLHHGILRYSGLSVRSCEKAIDLTPERQFSCGFSQSYVTGRINHEWTKINKIRYFSTRDQPIIITPTNDKIHA